jgi:transcriptional antiterminator RfaH
MSLLNGGNWYLLQCKPNQQKRAEEHLLNQGFETYSPEIRAERIIRRQRIVRVEALFPGYMFIQLNPSSNWRALQATRGVSRLVSFNGSPHIVPADLVAGLQQQYSNELAPIALFKAGDSVQITEGCFKNIEAIVKAVTSDARIIVLLKILHSEQTLAFPVEQLAKAG